MSVWILLLILGVIIAILIMNLDDIGPDVQSALSGDFSQLTPRVS